MTDTIRGLVIPQDGSPVREIHIDKAEGKGLDQLQAEVGGPIQSLPIPVSVVADGYKATAWVNEEGKYIAACKANMRATDFMVPGVGIFFGDYIAGNMVLTGTDPSTGEETDIPEGVEKRVRLIESEAA